MDFATLTGAARVALGPDLPAFFTHHEDIATLLNNIRESSNPIYQNAESGFYHQQIDSITPCQLIRIKIDSASTFYPDISGIKNRFTVRFMEIESLNKKQVQTKNNINFELHCCNL